MCEVTIDVKKKLEIILPVKNGEKYIHDSVGCVLNQTIIENIRLTIIDDGSTDNTGEICDDYARKYNNIRVFHLTGGGVSAARNYGIEHADAEWIAFLDADDLIYPEFYETLLKNALDNDCDISACSYVRTSERKLPECSDEYSRKLLILTDKKQALENMICDENSIEGYVWNKVYRSKVIKEVKFPTDIHFCEDCIFSWDAVMHANKICFTSEKLYAYFISRKKYRPMRDGVLVYKMLLERAAGAGLCDTPAWHTLQQGYEGSIIFMARNIALCKDKDPNYPTKEDARRYLSEINTKDLGLSFKQKLSVLLLKYSWPLFKLMQRFFYFIKRNDG